MLDRLFDFLVGILKIFKFWGICYVYEKGVVLRFGKFKREVGPGFIWLLPFYIDHLMTENVVLEALPVGPQSLTTKDGKSIVFGTVVSFTIEDVKKFLLEVEGRREFVEDVAYGIQAKFVLSKTWEELCNIDLENELGKTVRRRAKDWGVDIVRVQVSDFSSSRSIRLIQPLHRAVPQGVL